MPTSLMQLHADDTTSLPQLSIYALGATYFGRIHRQEDIISQGMGMYNQALRYLNKELQDPEKALSISVLSSAITLEVYEVSKKS